MNEEEVVAFLQGDLPVVAFDTNTIFGNNPRGDPGIELIDNLNRLNAERDDDRKIRKVISAVVYHEKIRQMRQRLRDRFDLAFPEAFLTDKDLFVEPFSKTDALVLAERLQRHYPTHQAWTDFKKERCLRCLGLSANAATQGRGDQCGATVDWLIVGHADANNYLLLTGDRGPEFKEFERKATLEVALAATERMLRGTTT